MDSRAGYTPPSDRAGNGIPIDPGPRRIPALDGFRAISILLVLFGHGVYYIPYSSPFLEAVAHLFANAPLGVTTFLVISGFLITQLLIRERRETGRIRLGAFYMRRAIRIFPVMYAYLAVITILHRTGYLPLQKIDLLMAATFTSNYRFAISPAPEGMDAWYTGHYWSLSLEEQFYLLWPAALIFLGRRAQWLAIGIILSSPPLRLATVSIWPALSVQGTHMFHCGADPLMLGCLVALRRDDPILARLLQRLTPAIYPICAAFLALLVTPWLAKLLGPRYLFAFGYSANALSATFLILWTIQHPESGLAKILELPAVRFIGTLSYSLYIWQQLFLTPMATPWTFAFPLNFLLCFVAAVLSYYAIERPFLGLRRRYRA